MSGNIAKVLGLLSILYCTACAGGAAGAPETPAPPAPPSYNYIALGDSLAAGVQDGTTNLHTQPHSYAAILAKQLAKAYGGTLTMPLLEVDGPRKNPDKVPTLLGISGEDSKSIFETKATGEALSSASSLHDRTLAPIAFAEHRGQPTSQLDAALWLAEQWKDADPAIPKIVTLWLNNDVLGSVVQIGNENYTAAGVAAAMTPPEEFRANMDFVLEKLAATGAEVFVGNIPDITQIAYLVSGETVKRWTSLTVPTNRLPEGARMSLPAALRIYADFLAGREWEATLAEHLADSSVLTAEEAAPIQARIATLNQILAELAAKHSLHLVDLNASLRAPQTVEGTTYTAEWGAGGFFCLDGVHFSHSGHAHTANLFIQAINQALGASVPQIQVSQVRLNDPYVDMDGDGFPRGPSYEPVRPIVRLLFQFRDADDSDPEAGIVGTPETIQEMKSLAIVP